MAVVFSKEVCRQYQRKLRAPNSIVDPAVKHVNSRIVDNDGSQIQKCNSLLNLNFLETCDTVRLKYHQKQRSKNNITIAKTNNSWRLETFTGFLGGSSSYYRHLSFGAPDMPADQFWSQTVYDRAIWAIINNPWASFRSFQ